MILTLENYRGQQVGFVGSLLVTSNGMAALLAFGMSYFAFSLVSPEWGWRLPYIFGSSIAILGFYLRQRIPESKPFTSYQPLHKNEKKDPNFIKKNIRNIVLAILSVGLVSTLTYTGFTFVNILLEKYLNFSTSSSLQFASLGTIFSMIMVLIGGKIGDKCDPLKTILFAGILLLIFLFPIHILLSQSNILLIIMALFLLSIPTGLIVGSMPRILVSLFPLDKRYRGTALSYNMAQALFGGAQPVIALYLIEKTGILWSPAIFTFSISVIFVLYLLKYRDEIVFYKIN